MGLTILEITLRLLIATFFGSIIGWEREIKSRPAGLRTHILVCVGATVVAMIQKQIMYETLQIAIAYPEHSGVIRSDPARLICQVISGIGFIGAGTIVKNKSTVHGITTAASLWVTAVVGLSIGMGYYWISVLGIIYLLFSLTVLKKIQSLLAILLPSVTRIEIQYNSLETSELIKKYFKDNKIKIKSVDFSMHCHDDYCIYFDDYTLEIPRGVHSTDIVNALSQNKNIIQIRVENLGGLI